MGERKDRVGEKRNMRKPVVETVPILSQALRTLVKAQFGAGGKTRPGAVKTC